MGEGKKNRHLGKESMVDSVLDEFLEGTWLFSV